MSKRFKREIIGNNNIKLNLSFAINMLFLVVIPMILIGFTVAKYMNEKEKDFVYEANDFYFESNLLSDSTNISTYTYSKGEDTIEIELKNNMDELRYSEVDINYEIKITDIYGNSVKDKSGNDVSTITGTLTKNAIDTEVIEFTNLSSGNYLITANALYPYTKTIQGAFNLTENDTEINWSVNDSQDSPILQITVLSEDYTGGINIIWPSGIAPDSTNKLLEDADTGYDGGRIDVYFEANSEYTFKFFKENPLAVYTKADFKIERSS